MLFEKAEKGIKLLTKSKKCRRSNIADRSLSQTKVKDFPLTAKAELHLGHNEI